MELAIMIDALKRSSAAEIEAVIPYYGYARQDRKARSREPITAKLIANLLASSGATRVITLDLHSDQIQGFFDIPLDNLTAMPIFSKYIKKLGLKNYVILAPDVGSSKKSQRIAEALDVPLVIVDKRRPKHNEAIVAHLIGNVKDKNVLIIDDMIDTAGTITAACNELPKFGAKDVYVFSTHSVFSEPAVERLKDCAAKEIVVTDSINLPDEKKFDNLKILSVDELLGETIKRIYKGQSVSDLFMVQ
jgi:ribose-phosphate pyrophosphokinase